MEHFSLVTSHFFLSRTDRYFRKRILKGNALMIVLDKLNKRSLSHSFMLFSYFPYKAKGKRKINHKTLIDLMYLET